MIYIKIFEFEFGGCVLFTFTKLYYSNYSKVIGEYKLFLYLKF